MIKHNIELDIKQLESIKTGIAVSQGDFGNVEFIIKIKNDGIYITDAENASIIFILPNGHIIEGTAIINNDTISYIFKGNELQCAGKIQSIITLKYNNGRISTCGFTFTVRYNPIFDEHINAGTYITSLEKIKETAQEQVKYLEQLISEAGNRADEVLEEFNNKLENGDFIGPPGPQGEQGVPGVSGVQAPSDGMFVLQLDSSTGNLYAVYPDGNTPPMFEYYADAGELYYVIEEDKT